jgi:predicted ester cyclase
MPEPTPKDVALRWVQEVWNEYRFDVIDELHADDYVRHHDTDASAGPEGYKVHLANVLRVIPDSHCHVEQVIADGELVMLRLMQSGTHRGRYGEVKPTGRRISFQAIDILRVIDGKIVESWHSYDRLSLLEQMGAARGIAFATAET